MPPLPLDRVPSGVADLPHPVDLAPRLEPEPSVDDGVRRPRRPWRDKFKCAFRGLKLGIRGHSSFAVHFFFAALVLAAAVIFKCELLEWCVLLGCIGLVLTAELFNSALETLFRGLDEASRARVWPALDVAAGAVLLASITAVVIGSIIFLRHLILLIWP
jgi:diacylglycerol kinase